MFNFPINNFQAAFSFVQSHGYFLIFLLMFFEGPMITAAAAFAASLGFFNIFLVVIISIIADLVADSILFFIGKYAKPVFQKNGKYFFLDKEKTIRYKELVRNNLAKAVITLKITPGGALPGLIFIGSIEKSFKKYILICLKYIIPSSLIFASIGYFFGFAFDKYARYVGIGKEVVLIIILFLILLFLLRKYYSNIIIKLREIFIKRNN